MLARVSIVNYRGSTVFDHYVAPTMQVVIQKTFSLDHLTGGIGLLGDGL